MAPEPEARAARSARVRRVGVALGAIGLVLVLVYSVFPVSTYLDQRSTTSRRDQQSEVLAREIDRLEERIEQLQQDEEIERLAREQYGLVMPGEEAFAVLPPPESEPEPDPDADPSDATP